MKSFNTIVSLILLLSGSVLSLNAQLIPIQLDIVGGGINGGVLIQNIVGDGITVVDTLGLTTDAFQALNPGDDAFYASSAGDDSFQSTNPFGDGFYSIGAGDDGFQSSNAFGEGMFISNSGGDGILVANSGGFAGNFNGNVNITGSIAKASGTFRIDHPLDPANKILSHSFVESPDMMNIYNGNTVLNANGESEITLPEWFSALNMEYRYQLTCVGGFAPVFIKNKIENNKFTIAGGKEGLEISWMVTGIRNDAYAQKFRTPVETEKSEEDKGFYLQPEAFNLPQEKSVLYKRISSDVEEEK